jgi:hypothetical protein
MSAIEWAKKAKDAADAAKTAAELANSVAVTDVDKTTATKASEAADSALRSSTSADWYALNISSNPGIYSLEAMYSGQRAQASATTTQAVLAKIFSNQAYSTYLNSISTQIYVTNLQNSINIMQSGIFDSETTKSNLRGKKAAANYAKLLADSSLTTCKEAYESALASSALANIAEGNALTLRALQYSNVIGEYNKAYTAAQNAQNKAHIASEIMINVNLAINNAINYTPQVTGISTTPVTTSISNTPVTTTISTTPVTTGISTTPVTTGISTTSIPNDCSMYEVDDPTSLYDVLNDTDPSMYDHMMECLQKQIIEKNGPLFQLTQNYGDNKLEAISASEQKLNTDIIYKDNLFYTTTKIFMFILLIAAYIYFFKDSGIFQPIKDGMNVMTTQFNKVKEIKMPNIKMPEVTMPSIKMPTK